MVNPKIELIESLKEGDRFNLYDSDIRTFEWIQKHSGLIEVNHLGGGNLSVALISITSLSFLAKCYVILSNKIKYQSCAKEKDKIKNKKGKYKYINETEAFITMMMDLDKFHKNFSNKEEKKKTFLEFWKNVRHKLVHRAFPNAQINPPYFHEEVGKMFLIHQFKEYKIYEVYSDQLWQNYMYLKDIIIQNVDDSKYNNSSIEDTLKFIKDIYL